MENALNWFEIPVRDMARATRFYSAIMAFEQEMEAGPSGEGYLMAMFPTTSGVGGALMHGEGYSPSMDGTLVYLNCGEDLSPVLGRVEAAGGRIITPKTSIGEHGAVAFVVDTEGNRVGLHSTR
jgi:uncharacterized protein